jgi:L-Ala-D/L-Glu epimerase
MRDIELKTLYLTTPFRIAHGASSTRQVVRVKDGDAVGEAPFVPYYHEDIDATLAWLQHPEGLPPTRAASLAQDLLLHDQRCRARSLPLSSVVPDHLPKRSGNIAACRSFSIPTDLQEFAGLVKMEAQRYHVLKLKLGSGDLEHDRQIVATAREAAGGVTLMADVNGGWSVKESVIMLADLEHQGLALIEQPFHHQHGIDAWAEFHRFRHQGLLKTTPVYADESVQNAQDVNMIAPYVNGVNVKLLKCGTLMGAVRMIEAAREKNLGVLLGCMIESSIGITAAAHLAPWADFADLDGHLYLAEDDYCGVQMDPQGMFVMPEKPGIGAQQRLT